MAAFGAAVWPLAVYSRRQPWRNSVLTTDVRWFVLVLGYVGRFSGMLGRFVRGFGFAVVAG